MADGTYLIDYSTPFYLAEFKNGSEVAGVVCASRSIEGIRTQIGSLDLGNTGYGFIFSEEGLIVSYPVQYYLLRNIHKLAKEDTELNLISENISKNMTGRVVENDRTGQSSWVFYKNILSTDWILGTALPQEEILLNKDIEQDRSIIQVMLLTFAFFILPVPAFCLHFQL
ncbi:PDC sensor domain-containing protein [Methanosarcina barkeri]|uniref:hypothetical protein n=1 Tax=Methanosarcina barkeri TaxID=2208 RepID=UPI00311EE695